MSETQLQMKHSSTGEMSLTQPLKRTSQTASWVSCHIAEEQAVTASAVT